MKAIQIKYISATDFKPARLKVWAEGVKPLLVSRDYKHDASKQAELLAIKYCHALGWGQPKGFGQLPNGDYVATLDDTIFDLDDIDEVA